MKASFLHFVFVMFFFKKGKSEYFIFQSIVKNSQHLLKLMQFQRSHVYVFVYVSLMS